MNAQADMVKLSQRDKSMLLQAAQDGTTIVDVEVDGERQAAIRLENCGLVTIMRGEGGFDGLWLLMATTEGIKRLCGVKPCTDLKEPTP